MVTRHQFLTALHELLRPKVYLEVGVQFGLSLDLAVYSEVAIGIDPAPHTWAKGNQLLFTMTSEQYFAQETLPFQIDLAFIDGSHLWEDAYQDFLNVVKLVGPKSVIVFDDVLPYNEAIAGREPLPGDWTGDVWRTMISVENAAKSRGVKTFRVNTFPTGTFVVWDFAHGDAQWFEDFTGWHPSGDVPDDVIKRVGAYEAQAVIDCIAEGLNL